ncbi:hypothetical protein A2291_03910 [candidate division WOR-1 bacterium RIFOXYB2_FULL_42_35]|uniref:Transcriptional regulator n=1 Tax=candidate division WOR-1 bacterium RIFOXYC2_FULL_41_25 TaxID=1802586 RepID=A0A1F4TJV7_UNCSA|nr:MAG: hypothetical protein A2247_06120 [candidate division WOR-1 bacterium RIFOXYA2_FULL_41_14]OGC21966.1 MAG: hypothetical protein A2291_03910 [candidate division WOR-1 bacterium RIFOXYB2_FULL_42_35]OGC32800.1 MAG: hypothetical protein A2462_07165 [candidate division WOR-1 bacterium RIFOXYC2_FULL_41_25]OGC43389.1 MAG: hypothetical protein A2548_02130 [candidate division WOR-1 bacterium RIFOXYD2_FULL_41_8]
MAVNFFDITRQNSELKDKLSIAISNVINSGRYILGQVVSDLEKEFAKYCGTKHAVGVASGTDAIHLALRAAGIKTGDEIITSPFTFVATIEAIVYCGATPVFADIEPKTFNIDVSKIEGKLSNKTKAILPVHLYGLAAEMDKIMAIAKKHNLKVIEDCAQAAGAEFQGKKVGSFGLGAFSFFPTKNLGCFGDGGMITTDSEEIVKELLALRNHGCHQTYHHEEIGFNSRLDALQAAVLKVKLPLLENYLFSRRENAKQYVEALKEIKEISLPEEPQGTKHTYNQFTIRIEDRDALHKYLQDRNIPSMVYYPISLHLQEAYQFMGYKPGDMPESEAAQNQVLSLPIFPELEQKEIAEICAAIKKFYNK